MIRSRECHSELVFADLRTARAPGRRSGRFVDYSIPTSMYLDCARSHFEALSYSFHPLSQKAG